MTPKGPHIWIKYIQMTNVKAQMSNESQMKKSKTDDYEKTKILK